jgi:hypothetical protein
MKFFEDECKRKKMTMMNNENETQNKKQDGIIARTKPLNPKFEIKTESI